MDENINPNAPKGNTLLKYAINPRGFILRKWVMDILKDKYGPHDNIVERISTALNTDRDLEEFGKLIMQVYETAYCKAVKDYKEQAEKLGIKVNVVDQIG